MRETRRQIANELHRNQAKSAVATYSLFSEHQLSGLA